MECIERGTIKTLLKLLRVSIKCVRINGGSWNNRNIVFNVDIQKTGPPHPHYLLGGHSALIALIGTPGGGDSGGNIIKQLLSNKRKSQLMKALTVDESHNQ
jgi:hypothetical protein